MSWTFQNKTIKHPVQTLDHMLIYVRSKQTQKRDKIFNYIANSITACTLLQCSWWVLHQTWENVIN